jgi:hypothetical protein
MLREGQFSLATIFVAMTCAATKLLTHGEPAWHLFILLVMPVLVCQAIGAIMGRWLTWIGYGIVLDMAILAALLLAAN